LINEDIGTEGEPKMSRNVM